MQSTSVKSVEMGEMGRVAHERRLESTATRIINASGRHVIIAVIVMLLAFAISAMSTLIIIFTRDLKVEEAGSVNAHTVDYLTDQRGSPVTSGNTLYQFDLVVDRAGVTNEGEIPAAAQSLVLFDDDPNAALGVFESRAHLRAFLSTVDTITLGMGTLDNPVNLAYRVKGFVASKERVTFRMNGATGDLDFHLLSDEEGVWATIGDDTYVGKGTMYDTENTQCTDAGDCDCPYCSPQEALVCGQPGVVCAERASYRRRTPSAFSQAMRRNRFGRMLEEGKPQRRQECAMCVAVGAAVAGGVASGVAGGEVSAERHTGAARGRWWRQ